MYAIDGDELVERCKGGKAGKMGILPEDHIWYSPDQPEYGYNRIKPVHCRRSRMGDAVGDGIRDKDGEKLSYILSLSSGEIRIGGLIKRE